MTVCRPLPALKFVQTQLILWLCTLVQIHTVYSGTMQHPNLYYKLYHDLMRDYSKNVRPSLNHSLTLNVTFGFSLTQIIDVDERNQILTTNAWINQMWLDYKLRWNPDEYAGIKKIHLPHEQVWLPDIVLYNNADSQYNTAIMSTDVFVNYHGNVTWLSAAIFKSSCQMNVRYYPFDEQICHLKFASWAFDGSLLDLILVSESGDDSNYLVSTEFDLKQISAKKHIVKYSCCEEAYPDITVSISISRKPLFYVFNLILPCVMITGIALLGFYMPSESGEKVTLGITTLLSLTVFMMLVAENMPPTSDALPLIGMYYGVTICLVSFATAMTVFTLNIHHKGVRGRRVPRLVRIMVFKYLARIICVDLVPPKLGSESRRWSQYADGFTSSTYDPLSATKTPGLPPPSYLNTPWSQRTDGYLPPSSQKITRIRDGSLGAKDHLDDYPSDFNKTSLVLMPSDPKWKPIHRRSSSAGQPNGEVNTPSLTRATTRSEKDPESIATYDFTRVPNPLDVRSRQLSCDAGPQTPQLHSAWLDRRAWAPISRGSRVPLFGQFPLPSPAKCLQNMTRLNYARYLSRRPSPRHHIIDRGEDVVFENNSVEDNGGRRSDFQRHPSRTSYKLERQTKDIDIEKRPTGHHERCSQIQPKANEFDDPWERARTPRHRSSTRSRNMAEPQFQLDTPSDPSRLTQSCHGTLPRSGERISFAPIRFQPGRSKNRSGPYADDPLTQLESQFMNVLTKIQESIDSNERRTTTEEIKDVTRLEWQQVAVVVDRLLLFLFVVGTVLSTTLILFQKHLIYRE